MKRLNALETRRQLVHLLVGLTVVSLLWAGALDALKLFALLAAGLCLSYAAARTRIPAVWWFLKKLERPGVRKKFPGKGTLYFVFGSLLVVLLFERSIALASIAILAIGDALGPLAGQFGSMPHPFSENKSLEGMLAGVLGGFAGALFFVSPPEALAASLAAMLAEGFDIVIAEKIDDNMTMPLAAGAAITVLRFFSI